MAAHLEGKAASIMDMTGLAQKGGAVLSHVRIADKPERLHAVRIGTVTARPGRTVEITSAGLIGKGDVFQPVR